MNLALFFFFFWCKTNQLWKFIGKCVRCMVMYVYTDDMAMVRTHFLKNVNSWFILHCKKLITTHTSQCVTTRNGSSIFNTAFCKFLWSDRYTIFTVLPETQKLYLPAISRRLVHKMRRKKIGKLTFETTLVKISGKFLGIRETLFETTRRKCNGTLRKIWNKAAVFEKHLGGHKESIWAFWENFETHL